MSRLHGISIPSPAWGGWRNVVISALSSILVTGLIAWFTWGMRAVNRDDVGVLLTPDRQMAADLREAVQDLTVQVRRHGEDVAKFSAILGRLEARTTNP